MNFTLRVLGSASAMPVPDKFPSAHVLDVHGRLFLIDCGEGTQMQMARFGVSLLKIDSIYLSHIHGDHVFGIFGLLSTIGMKGRVTPLHIYAPNSFGPILKFFLSYYGEGLAYQIEFHPVNVKGPEVIYETRNTEILAFPLNHKIETYGYLFREKTPMMNVKKYKIEQYGLSLAEIGALKRGEDVVREDMVIPNEEAAYQPYIPRSYAYCSDTAPIPELPEWVKGVDLLYHEATFLDCYKEQAEKRYHSTTLQAAACAKAAGAGKLLIAHYSSRCRNIMTYQDECRTIFPETYAVKDGDVFEVELKKLV